MSGKRIQLAVPKLGHGVLRGALQSGWDGSQGLRHPLSEQVEILPSLHSAAHEHLRLLTQERNFALFIRLMPWDHAAGAFILRQANGVVRCFDGTQYKPDDYTKPGILFAPDEETWRFLRSLVCET